MTLRALPIKDKFLTPQGEISEPWRKWFNDVALKNYDDPGFGEGHITILPWNSSVITQGTWEAVLSSERVNYYYFRNSSNAQNDQIDYKVFLAAGTYTLRIVTATSAAYAIITILIDGVSIGTIDLYSAATVNYVLKSLTEISISLAGLKTLSFKVATRNASNTTGWYAELNSIALFRSA